MGRRGYPLHLPASGHPAHSLGRSPQLRSFALLTRGSPRALPWTSPVSTPRLSSPVSHSRSRAVFGARWYARHLEARGRRISARLCFLRERGREVGGRSCKGISASDQETRERAERANVVRGSAEASVFARQDLPPTDRRAMSSSPKQVRLIRLSNGIKMQGGFSWWL